MHEAHEATRSLENVLLEAQDLGWIGRAPMAKAMAHARGFAAAPVDPPAVFADIGSGGGLPGLVLAFEWPEAEVVLIEGSAKRADFLQQAVTDLGIADRCTVLGERAEESGHRSELRYRCDIVVARGFGAPPVTAECGSPLLRPGGHLLVSEPPKPPSPAASASTSPTGQRIDGEPASSIGSDVAGERTPADREALAVRWPQEGLALLGMAVGEAWVTDFHYQSLVQETPCPERYPRRIGTPGKRPLF